MEIVTQLAVTLGIFLLLMGLGMDIAIAILIPMLFYLYLQGGWSAFNSLSFNAWGSLNSFTLTAVPLFLLMAECLSASGLAKRTYTGLGRLVRFLPGGLLQTNIVGCAIFASISSSSIATAAAISGVAMPQLRGQGYNLSIATGSLAAGGTLGILIPPSLAMIIFATMTQTSVPQLFLAGLVPGFGLALLFMIYIAIRCSITPALAPRQNMVIGDKTIPGAIADIVPFLVIIAGSLGTLYAGYVTVTEAATIGVLLTLVAGFTVGDLTISGLVEVFRKTVVVSGSILFLILSAFMFSSALGFGGLNESIADIIRSLDLSPIEFYIYMFAMYIIMGMFIESIPLMLITVPLLFPVTLYYGMDPLIYGVLMIMFIELALITPPVGVNLFVVQAISGTPLGQIIRGALPFGLIIVIAGVLILAFPEIVLWLPELLRR